MEKAGRPVKEKGHRATVEPNHYQICETLETQHLKSGKNANYKLPKDAVRHFENEPELRSNLIMRDVSQPSSGSESEIQKESLKKQRSLDFVSDEKNNYRVKAKAHKGAGNSDTEGRKDLSNNMGDKGKRTDEAYSSSVGSTKDRDHSQSSSVNSKDDTDMRVSSYFHYVTPKFAQFLNLRIYQNIDTILLTTACTVLVLIISTSLYDFTTVLNFDI